MPSALIRFDRLSAQLVRWTHFSASVTWVWHENSHELPIECDPLGGNWKSIEPGCKLIASARSRHFANPSAFLFVLNFAMTLVAVTRKIDLNDHLESRNLSTDFDRTDYSQATRSWTWNRKSFYCRFWMISAFLFLEKDRCVRSYLGSRFRILELGSHLKRSRCIEDTKK